jgi:ketosteroid isomerase-like protein
MSRVPMFSVEREYLKMRFAYASLLGLALFLVSPARADDLRAEVDAQVVVFRSAFLAGDGEKLASLYTTDAKVIAQGAPIASGRAEIAAFWKGASRGARDLRFATTAVTPAGEYAIEDGTVAITAADGSVMTNRYVVVWKRDGGQLRLFRDIWNAEK